MNKGEDKPTTSNRALLLSDGSNASFIGCPITVCAGDTVYTQHPTSPGGASKKRKRKASKKKRHRDSKKRKNISQLIRTLEQRTKTKSKIEITKTYKTLREPTFLPSVRMRKIKNYYEGGYFKSKRDEFKMAEELAMTGEPITNEDFFDAVTNGKSKRLAVAAGAGFGKSTQLKKLAKEILERKGQNANEHGLEQDTIVHLIDFKGIRPKHSTTLQECLFGRDIRNADDRESLLEWVEENQSKLILLIDSLDQASWDTRLVRDEVSWWEEASTETLMYNLMSGNIFPDVRIVVSSREHAITMLPEKARPETIIALTGLTRKDAEKLFFEILEESIHPEQQNLAGFDIIIIPIYTIFTAIAYEYCARVGGDVPEYVTGLLAMILEIFTRSTQMEQTNIDVLHKMMSMAYEGMIQKRLTFNETDLKRHGLKLQDVCNMMNNIPKDNIHPGLLMEGDRILIFCHQTLQEILAACYISKMSEDYLMSFTSRQLKEDFGHWSVVLQYLCGIVLNSEVKINAKIFNISVPDKNNKQEILRDALRRLPTRIDFRPAYYLALHESNDDELIRQLQLIDINTPLTSNLVQAIASLMRRSESMEVIYFSFDCQLTDEFLRLMATNMKGSRLQVTDLRLLESEWNVTCSTLKSFLDNLEVDQLRMSAFPTDYHEDFPNFENVKTLKMWLGDVIITNERDRLLFESEDYKMSGNFNKKEKLLKLHFKDPRYVSLVESLMKLCSTERVEVTKD